MVGVCVCGGGRDEGWGVVGDCLLEVVFCGRWEVREERGGEEVVVVLVCREIVGGFVF